jgi:phosphoribosylformylglycinamidine synthase
MLEGPVGAASFNNEFGRPNLCGYFRSFEFENRGYHKPIMLTGGIGNIRAEHSGKSPLPSGTLLVQLGGPGLLIGLGGGAASSVASGQSSEALDFASVQRDNPEMERRCQEVIDRCAALLERNPIRFMHDVGAGGLSNAIPELLHDSDVGGVIDLAKIPSDDPSLSPMQLWSNESQERYVLGIGAEGLAEFEAICARERCPYAVVGHATAEPRLLLAANAGTPQQGETAIDMPMDLLFGKPPKMHRDTAHPAPARWPKLDASKVDLREAGLRVLAHPTVAAKNFLVTIGDRTVGGLSARDQMVGPWQLPLADCAITLTDFHGLAGEAMAIGERTPLALLDAAASARMAVGEAITNLAAAPVASLAEVKLSANWMAAAGHEGEDALLYDAVHAIGMELCPELDISIPVGKDSLSMQARWNDSTGALQQSVAPVSLVVTAFARVADARAQLTPVMSRELDSELWLIGLGAGQKRMGGSVLAQVHGAFGGACPDLDDAACLRSFFELVQEARADKLLLAYHDRSDGGAFAAACEMAFASHLGLELNLDAWTGEPAAALFNEELGAIVQVASEDRAAFADLVNRHDLTHCAQRIGRPVAAPVVRVLDGREPVAEWTWMELFDAWWSVTHAMQKLRDDPDCADEERVARRDFNDPGLSPKLVLAPRVEAPMLNTGARPRVAILREQGVNSQQEMAAAFTKAGFLAVDVHMSDLIAGRHKLSDFRGLAACGGFSYGDVLGAGRGWATSILERPALRDAFAAFFAREDSFSLGVCNGCQMFAQLKSLVPGAGHWPRFLRNRSEQFEARLALAQVEDTPSLFFRGMAGSRIPIAVSHGEGRARFDAAADAGQAIVALRYVEADGRVAERYPANPNGSPLGIAGLTSADGRSTLLMPHPERVHRTVQMSWHPADWGEDSPWQRMFENARAWV